MRKLILATIVSVSLTGLLFTSTPTIPTGHCFDCAGVRDTCSEASVSIYTVCRAGGASHENCELDQVNWYNNCVRSNSCWPINN